ncbi:MAG TPA: SMC-Scp complex subunit ScpB [Candidatus Acidoferrales bacterium]|nr:SMC-Scp complex subunit ScpB [Candidatus Acidoferrales bacterium]
MEDLEIQPEPIEVPEASEPLGDASEPLGDASGPLGAASEPGRDHEAAVSEECVPEAAQLSMEELLSASEPAPPPVPLEDAQLRAVLEAIVYVAEEPLTLAQLASALQQPAVQIHSLLDQLIAEFDKPEHGISIREVAGGYKMTTKAEHHEAVRNFVKGLKPPLKLSLPALETLAVIAYKQPVTGPEIMEIRGVQGAGVLKTLLDRKLIAVAGRKNVIGKPILYKTTKEFLIQFGLKDLTELPSLKEFEEIRRMAFSDEPAGETGAGGSEAGAGGQGPGAGEEAETEAGDQGSGAAAEVSEVPPPVTGPETAVTEATFTPIPLPETAVAGGAESADAPAPGPRPLAPEPES